MLDRDAFTGWSRCTPGRVLAYWRCVYPQSGGAGSAKALPVAGKRPEFPPPASLEPCAGLCPSHVGYSLRSLSSCHRAIAFTAFTSARQTGQPTQQYDKAWPFVVVGGGEYRVLRSG